MITFLARLGLLLVLVSLPGRVGAGEVRVLADPAQIAGAGPRIRALVGPGNLDSLSDATREAIRRRREFPHHLLARGAEGPRFATLKELLARGRDRGDGLVSISEAPLDTVRLAIFRIEFEQDSHGDLTTGNGRFDLRTGTEVLVDPPPHDKRYFETHAEALRRYYDTQSYGTLHIEPTVFPAGDTEAYRLPDTGAFGPWDVTQDNVVIEAAEAFVGACIDLVASSGDLNLADFDAFVVVHAGSDFQSDIRRDTPEDIPTFTLEFGDSSRVKLEYGLDKVLVLPETSSQDDALGALNGVFAHEFGHILGLIDLYNIYNGVPQVGYWSLMDSGENIAAIVEDPTTGDAFEAVGIFPTSLDPWSKLHIFPEAMQLEVVEETWSGVLEATEISPVIPLVALDPFEYYLVENRALDLDGNEFPFVQQDSLTNVFLGPVDDPENPGAGGRHEYDAVLPGGGVLIWHIDDFFVQRALRGPGDVNFSTGFRGIAVEEADGVWDQGRFNFGRPQDAFYEGNNTLFGPETVPDSRTNTDAYTGIRIEISGRPARNMGVSATRPLARTGWPAVLREDLDIGPSTLVDLDGDGAPEFLFDFEIPATDISSRRRGLLAFGADGRPLNADEGGGAVPFDTFAQRMEGRFVAAPAFALTDGGTPVPVAAATDRQGQVLLWSPAGREFLAGVNARTSPALAARPGGGRLVVGGAGKIVVLDGTGATVLETASTATTTSAVAGPVLMEQLEIPLDALLLTQVPWVAALAFEGGTVELFALEGNLPATASWSLPSSGSEVRHLVAGPVSRDAYRGVTTALVAFTDQDIRVIDPTAREGSLARGLQVMATWPLENGAAIRLSPVLGDLDGDGLAEIAAASDSGTVWVWNGDGSPAFGWPQAVPFNPPRDLKMMDVDGDGDLELLALDGEGFLHAWESDGRSAARFPRSLGPFSVGDTWIGDLDGDGRLTYLAGSDEAVISALRLPGALARSGDWRSPAGTPEGTRTPDGAGRAGDDSSPDLGRDDLVVYPNPVRGGRVEIRFLLRDGESAELEILDVAGEQVSEIGGDRLSDRGLEIRGGFGAGENAALWTVEGVPPGLYFCRLNRRGAGAARLEITKIAVLQ